MPKSLEDLEHDFQMACDADDAREAAAKLTFEIVKQGEEYFIMCSNGAVVPAGFTKREAERQLSGAKRDRLDWYYMGDV